MDELKDIDSTPQAGTLVDETDLSHLRINDVKKWLMVDKRHKLKCCHQDGHLAAKTPLILSTNCRDEPGANGFWPDIKFHPDQAWAIDRRVIWVNVTSSVIKPKAAPEVISSPLKRRIEENKEAARKKKEEKRRKASLPVVAATPSDWLDFEDEDEDELGLGGGIDQDE